MRPLRDSRQKEKVKRQNRLIQTAVPCCLLPFTFYLLPSYSKELLHQRATLSFQNSFDYLHAMIELFGVADMKMRFDGARFFIPSALNQPLTPPLIHPPAPHRPPFIALLTNH